MSTDPGGWLWEATMRSWSEAISDLMLSSLALLVSDWAWITSSCLALAAATISTELGPGHPGHPWGPVTECWRFIGATWMLGVKLGGMLWKRGPCPKLKWVGICWCWDWN